MLAGQERNTNITAVDNQRLQNVLRAKELELFSSRCWSDRFGAAP
jgi:hypothetical protein